MFGNGTNGPCAISRARSSFPCRSFTTGGIILRADGGPYVIYCHHGIRSYQVCTYLSGLGLRNLINMKGGIDRWSRTVDPSVPIY